MSSGFESMTADLPVIEPRKTAQQLADDLEATPHGVLGVGAGGHSIPAETPPLPDRPSEEPERAAAPEGDGSPSAVEQHEIALTQEWARLIAELPNVKFAEGVAVSQRRFIQAEMERVRRLLAVHKRLREPIKRRAK